MIAYLKKRHTTAAYKTLCSFIAFAFLSSVVLPPQIFAQMAPVTVLNLPRPGTIIPPSPAYIPAVIQGLKIHPEHPFRFDFIVNAGDSNLQGDALKEESTKLIKYFLASLTIPEEELWVNLSPYEKDRIIPDAFGLTEMGRDMLAQDYILKQLTASLMYPEKELGKEFWAKVYQKAKEQFGTTQIPVNTFNKVWIIPDKAEIYETKDAVFVVDTHLKVMLEADYLALKNEQKDVSIESQQVNDVSSAIVREVILPAIEKEVNEGKNFAAIRQIYHSLILAKWYKQTLKNSLLSRVYAQQSKVAGIEVDDKEIRDKIYQQYLDAFKKGVYNYIKEDYDPVTQKTIPRKYFSGGITGFASIKLSDADLPKAGRIVRAAEAESSIFTTDFQPQIDQNQKKGIDPERKSVTSSPVEDQIIQELKTIYALKYRILDTTVDITEFLGVNALIRGDNKSYFPLPNGQTWKRIESLKIGTSLKRVEVIVHKNQGGQVSGITFVGYKEKDGQEYENKRSDWIWTGERMEYQERAQHPTAERLKKIYALEYKVPETTLDITEYLGDSAAPRGEVKSSFPLPNGGAWGKQETLKIETDLKRVKVIVRKNQEGQVTGISFVGYKEKDGQEYENKRSDWIWTGERMEYQKPAEDPVIKRLVNIYAPEYKIPETIVDITEFLGEDALRTGMIKASLPLPNGKNWGKTERLKIGIRLLKRVELIIYKNHEGEVTGITFVGYKEDGGKAYESGRSNWTWTGKRMEYQKPAEDPVIEKLMGIYAPEYKIAETTIDITDFLGPSGLRQGKSHISIPLPNGQVWRGPETLKRRRPESLRIGIDLKRAELIVHKNQNGQVNGMTFVGYKEQDGQEYENKRSHWAWSGERMEYQMPVENPVIERLRNIYSAKYRILETTIDITNLFGLKAMTRGIKAGFLLPNGKIWSKREALKVGIDLKRLELIVHKDQQGQVTGITFVGYKEGENSEEYESGRSDWTWTGTKMEYMSEDEKIINLIKSHNLADVVADSENSPDILYAYIMLTTDLDPAAARFLTIQSFKGLKGQSNNFNPARGNYEEASDNIVLNNIPTETGELLVEVKGKAEGGYRQIQIVGDRQRVIDTDEEGNFSFKLMLEKGRSITLSLYGFDDERGARSRVQSLTIQQTSKPRNVTQILEDLITKREDVRRRLKDHPEQYRYIIKRMELGLLRHFTESETDGFGVLETKIKNARTTMTKMMYRQIKDKFGKVANEALPEDFKETEMVLFYQKYILHEMRQRLSRPDFPGLVLALEQGLGKTIITQLFIREDPQGAVAAVPNAVLTSWGEEEDKFFHEEKIEIVTGNSSTQKRKILQTTDKKVKVVNIEFVREHAESLNANPNQKIIYDESQSVTRSTDTKQAQGARKIRGSQKILISATPFSSVQKARMVLEFLETGRSRAFEDQKKFQELFNRKDPDSMRLLHFMFDPYVLRLKKEHVFKTQEKGKPLQKNRLPNKNYIDPSEMGQFELTTEQAESIFQLFTDWEGWKSEQLTRRYKTIDDEEFQRRQGAQESAFSTMHSLRQIANDTKYVGVTSQSPKHLQVDKIIDKEVVRQNGKVLIFARYKEQVRKYQERYKKHGAVTFYGDTESEFTTKNGFIADKNGNIVLFKVEPGRSPVPSRAGKPLSPMDYNRHAFQNDPNVKVIIATYESGAVGVTLTAADAVVHDDFAREYTEEEQADARAHRVDNVRLKYEVRYYTLVETYPQSFLDKMKQLSIVYDKQTHEKQIIPTSEITSEMKSDETLVIKSVYSTYFSQGTFSQVNYRNFQGQKLEFELIMDGVADPERTALFNQQRLKTQMPFLFTPGNGILAGNGKTGKAGSPIQSSSPIRNQIKTTAPGGIDFNPNLIELEKKGDGLGGVFPDNFDFKQIESMPINGFIPVIINIAPAHNLPMFLGLKTSNDTELTKLDREEVLAGAAP